MIERDFTQRWSELHGNVEISGVVRIWLTISYRVSRTLQLLRITPNQLTSFGVLAALLIIPQSTSLSAAGFLVLSLLCDGLDGSLAILSEKSSERGALFDSIADRISEAVWAITFYKIGAPFALVATAWLLANAQEYLRARAGGLGFPEIGVVSIAERPVRASLLFFAMVALHLKSGLITPIAALWLAMQAVALCQVARSTYRRLSPH